MVARLLGLGAESANVETRKDERKRSELGESGRKYVQRNFSWVTSAVKFEHMCAVASGIAG